MHYRCILKAESPTSWTFFRELRVSVMTCCRFLRSDSDPRLLETAQHEKQTGEQDGGRRNEEDPDGHHHGPAGSAGGENEQDSGFHREQTERMKPQSRSVTPWRHQALQNLIETPCASTISLYLKL